MSRHAAAGVPVWDEDADRGRALRDLEREMSTLFGQLRRMYAEIAHRFSPGMLPGTYKVFSVIAHHGPLTASAIAERMIIDKGQVSRVVRELTELGFVQRTPDPSDGRSALLAASDAGLERMAELRGPDYMGLRETLAEWSADELDSLTRLLSTLRHAAPAAPGDECTATRDGDGHAGGAE